MHAFSHSAEFEVMCMFKSLHEDSTHIGQHQPISREEFNNFYEVQDMRWKQVCTMFVHRNLHVGSNDTILLYMNA